MASKIGLILSFFFVVLTFLFASDLIHLQLVYTNLDAVATTAGHLIIEHGGINEEIESFVLKRANAQIICLENCSPRFGDTYIYNVTTIHETMFMSKDPLTVSITRSVVIGYYR